MYYLIIACGVIWGLTSLLDWATHFDWHAATVTIWVQPYMVTGFWTAYVLVILYVLYARIVESRLSSYTTKWLKVRKILRELDFVERHGEPPADETAELFEEHKIAQIAVNQHFDWDAGLYTHLFDHPRLILLSMIVQTLLWPVELVMQPFIWTYRWAKGKRVVKTILDVLLLRESE